MYCTEWECYELRSHKAIILGTPETEASYSCSTPKSLVLITEVFNPMRPSI
jgi:hypothetical protein